MNSKEAKKIIYNEPQLRSLIYNAPIQVDIMGRGTGKTTLLAVKAAQLAHEMPGGTAALVQRTYKHILELSIPSTIASWERMGYYENIHFVIRRKPPERWPKPIMRPASYDHFISWYTGFGIYLVSQERKGSFRGPSVDYVFGDEGLNLDKNHWDDEVMAANRGNKNRFGNHPLHHGVHISSSMPIGKTGRWLLDYGLYYPDYEARQNKIHKITELQLHLIDNATTANVAKLFTEINRLKKEIQWFPDKKTKIYYNEANGFDNIENLGFKYFTNNRLLMSELKYLTEILNRKPTKAEKGFYPDLSADEHGYYAINYDNIDKHDCRRDEDHSPALPLRIALDYGGYFNCMVVGQYYSSIKELRYLKNFYAEHPKRTKDVVQEFIDYYATREERTVYYHYDQTAIGISGQSDQNYSSIVMDMLRKAKWNVIPVYMGKAPDHYKKYELWGACLQSRHGIMVKFNRENMKETLFSMEMAPIKRLGDTIEKDKSSEKPDSGIPQVEATHLSDCADQLLWGLATSGFSFDFPFIN